MTVEGQLLYTLQIFSKVTFGNDRLISSAFYIFENEIQDSLLSILINLSKISEFKKHTATEILPVISKPRQDFEKNFFEIFIIRGEFAKI